MVQVLHAVSGILGEAAAVMSLPSQVILSHPILTVPFPGSISMTKAILVGVYCAYHNTYSLTFCYYSCGAAAFRGGASTDDGWAIRESPLAVIEMR